MWFCFSSKCFFLCYIYTQDLSHGYWIPKMMVFMASFWVYPFAIFLWFASNLGKSPQMVMKSKGIPYKIVTKTVEICLGFIPTQVVAGNHHRLMSCNIFTDTPKKKQVKGPCATAASVWKFAKVRRALDSFPRQRCVINRRWFFYLPIYSLDTRGFFRKGYALYRPNLGVELLGCGWVRDGYRGVARNFFGEMES